jgi:hypothetical protein
MLLAGDKRLLRKGSDLFLLCNQKGNYETLAKPRMKAIKSGLAKKVDGDY